MKWMERGLVMKSYPLIPAVIALLMPSLTSPVHAQKGAGLEGQAKADAILYRVFDNMNPATDAHFHKGEYNHIINLDRMVMGALPDRMNAYEDAGWLLWSMDRDAEAVVIYEKGLKANPNSFYMYDELGLYYMTRKKDYARAVSYYEKAAGFSNCPRPTFHMLAHAYEKSKQFDKSLAVWKKLASQGDAPAKVNYDRVKRLRDGQGR
jgi:tetratricopeptide (TPR) repeat protein